MNKIDPTEFANELNLLSMEIRKGMLLGDLMEAITEAPTSLQNHLFNCLKEGDFCDAGATIHDMVGLHCDRQALSELENAVICPVHGLAAWDGHECAKC